MTEPKPSLDEKKGKLMAEIANQLGQATDACLTLRLGATGYKKPTFVIVLFATDGPEIALSSTVESKTLVGLLREQADMLESGESLHVDTGGQATH
jgi:hypothetical protein